MIDTVVSEKITEFEQADLTCLMCGRLGGIARRKANNHPIFIRIHGASAWKVAQRKEKCGTCGGSLTVEEFRGRKHIIYTDKPDHRSRVHSTGEYIY